MKSRLVFLIVVLASLTACASGARTGAMTAPVSSGNIISEASSLRRSIIVSEVGGGKETNPLWMSNVGNNEFKSALEQSLMLHALLDTSAPRYKLEAKLIKLRQPLGGFDVTVGSHVYYSLSDIETNERVYDADINCDYTAALSDAFLGYERLRLANEGSIKKNISLFIEGLVAEFRKRDAEDAVASETAGSAGS